MKNLLMAVVLIAVIVVIIYVIFGRGGSSPSVFGKDELALIANHQGIVSSYDITLVDGITVNDIAGCYLPDSATGMHGRIDFTNLTWKGYVVAEIPKDDFYKVVDKLELVEKPDILESRPDAFEYSSDDFKYWDITDSPEGKMYYFEDQEVETYIAIAYIDGKMYLKRQTRYTLAETDSDVIDLGKIRKLKKGEQHKPIGAPNRQ